ncbi:hypothetical protein HMPREF0322_02385 [Desulfitobacterium hafniense DP7]|uniref:Uncharacterized protein n=1 Tax=Desulfitobacterium hafniense DP7 TaxID=537010 RepID=G9XN43_DESHA|nr:hypothetical protein HMPREF0322_02385 [Desulfitobacterium hafniense DP7]
MYGTPLANQFIQIIPRPFSVFRTMVTLNSDHSADLNLKNFLKSLQVFRVFCLFLYCVIICLKLSVNLSLFYINGTWYNNIGWCNANHINQYKRIPVKNNGQPEKMYRGTLNMTKS